MSRIGLLSATFCMLALAAFTTSCKKNKVAAQPPAVPPTPAASRPKHRQAPSTPAAAVTSVPAQQPATPPRLGQMLTPTQERQFNTEIDQSLGNARTSLSSVSGRGLSRDQITIVQQIKGFMQQAQAVRNSDLLAAKGLADKADVLARDLLRSFQ